MPPIYTAFFTRATIYEQEAARLRRSLDRLGLPHDFTAIADRGSWEANTHFTAIHLQAMQAKYPDRPIVYLDADAVVWQTPAIFDDLAELGTHDIAVHYRRGVELLNGTLWLAPTLTARIVVDRYAAACAARPAFRDEQRFLAQAINETPGVRVLRLPPEYCWIHDLMADDIGDKDPVVEHLQASRAVSGSSLLPNRVARLKAIESMC